MGGCSRDAAFRDAVPKRTLRLRLAPGLRLGLACGYVLTVVSLPRDTWLAHAVAAGVLVVVGILSRVPLSGWFRRILWLEPFVVSVAALALFQPDGLTLFGVMLAKSTLCLACMLLLSSSTPFHQLAEVLRQWRVPGLLVTTLVLAHRYLFVLAEESHRMRRARASRTLVATRAQWWTLLAGIVAQLFLRASERAERIYAAMCARGWRP